MPDKCIFTGNDTSNCEHIIPKWLQRRFDLFDQILQLPNKTDFQYRNAVIPVEKECNDIFGSIENNLARNVYNLNEIYLWALKIHLGLLYKDSLLKFDISDKESPYLIDMNNHDVELALFRLFFDNWKNNGNTEPNPLGSVFIFKSYYPENVFDFFHCVHTGTIGINLRDKFILVFLWDQCYAIRHNTLKYFEKNFNDTMEMNEKDKTKPEYLQLIFLAYHVLALEMSYFLYRRRHSFNVASTINGKARTLFLLPPFNPAPLRYESEKEYRLIANNYGLDVVKYDGRTSPHVYNLLSSIYS